MFYLIGGMLEVALLNGSIGLLAGITGSFIGFMFWPWLQRQRIWKGLKVAVERSSANGGFWCRVVNNSGLSMRNAVAYITINHGVSDILDPPQGRDACNKRHQEVTLREAQVSWAVQEGGENPMRVDVYSGEEQPLVFGFIEDDSIEIISEKFRSPARVFLTRKVYIGSLKIVCLDCPAKRFPFEIDPDNHEQPLTFLR